MDNKIIKNILENQHLPLPGLEAQKKMMVMRGDADYNPNPIRGKESAVLINLYPTNNNDVNVILIQRTIDNSPHSGQIAFPGGKKEEEDTNLEATALREAMEEININPQTVNIIQALSPVYIPISNFKIQPYLSFCEHPPINLDPNPTEVAQILHFDLNHLFEQKVNTEYKLSDSVKLPVKAYQYNHHIVWGATAMMLAELEEIVKNLR